MTTCCNQNCVCAEYFSNSYLLCFLRAFSFRWKECHIISRNFPCSSLGEETFHFQNRPWSVDNYYRKQFFKYYQSVECKNIWYNLIVTKGATKVDWKKKNINYWQLPYMLHFWVHLTNVTRNVVFCVQKNISCFDSPCNFMYLTFRVGWLEMR